MTEHTLAIMIVAGLLFTLLPGTMYKRPPEIDWLKPNVYIGLLREIATIWLLVSVLT